MKIKRRNKILFYGVLILALPAAGYAIARLLITTLPMQNDFAAVAGAAGVIVTLLVVPYLMLKILFHNVHLADRHQRELELKELPEHEQKGYIEKPTVTPVPTNLMQNNFLQKRHG